MSAVVNCTTAYLLMRDSSQPPAPSSVEASTLAGVGEKRTYLITGNQRLVLQDPKRIFMSAVHHDGEAGTFADDVRWTRCCQLTVLRNSS